MSKKKKKQLPQGNFPASILRISHDGRGIAEIDGKTTFITAALPGEQVEFKYRSIKGRYNEGIVVEINEAANNRAEPPCPHFLICGGCSMQHMTTESQREYKQKHLLDQIKHIGHTEAAEIMPAIIGPTVGYRHKARLGSKYVYKKEKFLLGFREKQSRFLAEIESCAILHPNASRLIAPLKILIGTLHLFQKIPQVEIAIGEDKTAIIIRHLESMPKSDREQLITFAKEHHIDVYLQVSQPYLLEKLWPVTDSEHRLHYNLDAFGITFSFHPCDFTQVNPDINQQMVIKAIELLELSDKDTVLDLFCGLGNFSLPLSKSCQQVIGIEGSEEMVARATENARNNGIENTSFFEVNLMKNIAHHAFAKQSYTKILLDPPRSGALELIEQINQFQANRLVYISCNPATLARDTDALVHKQGYHLSKLGIIDMFPHTSHVEAIAVFDKS